MRHCHPDAVTVCQAVAHHAPASVAAFLILLACIALFIAAPAVVIIRANPIGD